LKIIELKLLEEDRGIKPLLLMDDVFSELDGSRRKALTKTIKGYQTFITTTDADLVVHHFTETCHVIPITH
jgi:DNA replication and repair protein RecF